MDQGGPRVAHAQTNSIAKAWIAGSFVGILGVSFALIGLTYQIGISPQTIPLEWQWNLRWEHNFAAWWSGSLLALACVLGLDNAQAARTPALRRAWIVLAMILLFLSLDEIGSLHERMGMWSNAMGAGTWALAIPLGIIIAIMSIRAGWVMLMEGGKARVQIIVLAMGFAVLLSVAVQEYFEHALDWSGSGRFALRAMIEEGSELVGIAIVLIAVGLPLWNAPGQALAALPTFERAALVRAVILAVPLLLISSDLLSDKGYPSDWLASALFLGGALMWTRQVWSSNRWLTPALMAALLVLASLGSVALGYDESFHIAGLDLARRGAVYAVLAVGFLALVNWRLGLAILAPAIALVMLAGLHPLWVFASGTVCAIAAFWATSVALNDQNGISSSRSS